MIKIVLTSHTHRNVSVNLGKDNQEGREIPSLIILVREEDSLPLNKADNSKIGVFTGVNTEADPVQRFPQEGSSHSCRRWSSRL